MRFDASSDPIAYEFFRKTIIALVFSQILLCNGANDQIKTAVAYDCTGKTKLNGQNLFVISKSGFRNMIVLIILIIKFSKSVE